MKIDFNNSKRAGGADGNGWEVSIRGGRYSPFGIFITTPRRRLWVFLRRVL